MLQKIAKKRLLHQILNLSVSCNHLSPFVRKSNKDKTIIFFVILTQAHMSIKKKNFNVNIQNNSSFALQLSVQELYNLNSALDVMNDFHVSFEYLELNANLETTRFRTNDFKLKSPKTIIDQTFTVPRLTLSTSKGVLRMSFVQGTKVGL